MQNDPRYKQLRDPTFTPMVGERWVREQWKTFTMIFFYGDTVTIRALLMVASWMQAIGFILPFDPLSRPFYADMRWLPAWTWATLFLLHAVGQWWRFRSTPNTGWGLAINLYGLILWTFTTILNTLSIHAFTPSTALEWTVIIAFFASTVRTGDITDRMSP